MLQIKDISKKYITGDLTQTDLPFGVKSGLDRLIREAGQMQAQAVLFGHTHEKLCYRETDGLWVVNPGSCRSDSGSVALLETADGKISACTLLGQAELPEL